MRNIKYLPDIIINYISDVIIDGKKKRGQLDKKYLTYFKEYCLILAWTFSAALVFSIVISFVSTSLLTEKNREIEIKETNYSYRSNSYPLSFLKGNIIGRNIFNLSGDIPLEDKPDALKNFSMKNFDKQPCSKKDKFPLDVLGIIYTGNPKTNLITLKDPKIANADVYKEGQKIIDYDSYQLYKIVNSSSAEFIHDTRKVCVSLHPEGQKEGVSKSSAKGGAAINISSTFVQDQLGPGFSKVLNSARLVPQIIDGKTTGFKIFSIAKDSLFDKLELSNGDVIKNVNGINLQDPAQGFKIYEAFQDENNITIQIDRNGETLTKRVTVE